MAPAAPIIPTHAKVTDLTALRQQIMTNTSLLYPRRTSASIIITGKTLFTAHILGSPTDLAEIVASGSGCADLSEAYLSLLRELATRLQEGVAKAQKVKVGGLGKK